MELHFYCFYLTVLNNGKCKPFVYENFKPIVARCYINTYMYRYMYVHLKFYCKHVFSSDIRVAGRTLIPPALSTPVYNSEYTNERGGKTLYKSIINWSNFKLGNKVTH